MCPLVGLWRFRPQACRVTREVVTEAQKNLNISKGGGKSAVERDQAVTLRFTSHHVESGYDGAVNLNPSKLAKSLRGGKLTAGIR